MTATGQELARIALLLFIGVNMQRAWGFDVAGPICIALILVSAVLSVGTAYHRREQRPR